MASSLEYALHRYGTESELQRLGTWDVDMADKSKYWIIYIHGGAWRDPRITHETFKPSIDAILACESHTGRPSPSSTRIAAFASLDYRLSPHPSFPQDPASTPPSQYRNATHPDHVDDVRSALRLLQREYGFGSNYVLVGHSAGACLALQLLMGIGGGASGDDEVVILPQAIVPFEGLYDFPGIVDRFGDAYAEFFRAAFGPSERWNAAAPMKLGGSYGDRWGEEKVALLGWSRDDELVDEAEVDGMAERLGRDGVRKVVSFKELEGRHDEIWEKGVGVARMVQLVLEELTG